MSPHADNKATTGESLEAMQQPKSKKQLSLELAQQRLVSENRRSPRQRTALSLESVQQDRQQNDMNIIKSTDDCTTKRAPAPGPRLKNDIISIESLRFA